MKRPSTYLIILLSLALLVVVARTKWRQIAEESETDRAMMERLAAMEAFVESRKVAPADVLNSNLVQHREIMEWLRDHAVTCEPCPPCQSGDDGEIPGS